MPRYARQPARMKMGVLWSGAMTYDQESTLSPHGILSAITHANTSLWWVPRGPEIVAAFG